MSLSILVGFGWGFERKRANRSAVECVKKRENEREKGIFVKRREMK